MWDSLLYAVNMFYYHRLIKNLLWSMAGQSRAGGQTKLNSGRKNAESERSHVAAEGDRRQNRTCKQ